MASKRQPLPQIWVLHGPNLNLLGQRETDIYGREDLKSINSTLGQAGKAAGYRVVCRQSNHEGELVDWVQQAHKKAVGILLNGAAYTHTSVALRDAIAAGDCPCVEVHLSNVYKREPFRHGSFLAPVCLGVVSGLGAASYTAALHGLLSHLSRYDDT